MLWTTLNNRFPRIATLLGAAVHNERAGHAYLFVGDSPDLLAECAKAWAQARSCQASREDGTPCGQCRNCLLIERDTCPELYVLKPRSKSRAIVVDRIREFEHQLGLTVEKGRLKVGLIQEAECMNPQAQNAFLKTLEEPPPRTLLLLTTTNPRRLLPTIRSRCQQLSLLQNQRDYALALEGELPAILSELRAESGAGVALRAATTLCERFSCLRDRAAKEAEESADPRWEQAAEDDAQPRKQLETEQKF
jgi:DNA polymerase III delta prime subunit